MNATRIAPLLVLSLVLTGCMSAKYTRPTHVDQKERYSVIIDKPFDPVWKDLIQYSASTFFAIDNFEKDSGLITLSFGSSDPERFVTGGYWETTGAREYSGDYVGYLDQYWNASLSGKMNIVVVELGPKKTRVTVRARYVFTTPAIQKHPSQTWTFDTGNCDTIAVQGAAPGTQPARTVCPTYNAENAIISAVR